MSTKRYTIAILGTGAVGTTLATRLRHAGHSVVFGSRNAAAADLPNEHVTSYVEAALEAEIVLNATPGSVSCDVLASIDQRALAGKVLIDVANGIVHSEAGRTLRFSGTSIAERIQDIHPETRVVKTLNTVHTTLMADPASTGDVTTMFVSGNDSEAKGIVTALLDEMGWQPSTIVDLGDITAARGQEAYLLLLNDLIRAIGTPTVNISIHHAEGAS